MTNADKGNYRRINLKRKVFARGKRQNFKRFKRTPKFIKDNPENQVARQKEKDVFDFSESDDYGDDLGMGLEISDIINFDDNFSEKQKEIIALSQESVRPFFCSENDYDETKLQESLVELRYSTFRPNQMETIKRILFGRSTLFISPTGSGKSLCYQLPALINWRYRKYSTIVVSPLISLMEDQLKNFPSTLKAISLHSGQNKVQRRNSIESFIKQDSQVLFITPEAIVGGVLQMQDLQNLPPIGFVCIDEAHCLSEWSHNFRPAYLQFFNILRDQLKIKTFLGLTATATRATSFAIAKRLTINPETDVIGATQIPDNLILSVSHENKKEKALIELLKTPTFRIMPSIIVYCNRREVTEKIASVIRTAMQAYCSYIEAPERRKSTDNKTPEKSSNQTDTSASKEVTGISPDKDHIKLPWNAEPYHAGLPAEMRKRIQRQFIKGEIRVVVATLAFGMGINKSNVRAVIHYDMPGSIESYVQEIGRAGRDGKPSQCHMFLSSDKMDLYYQLRNIYGCVTERKNLRKFVDVFFEPCRCSTWLPSEKKSKLDRLNETDKHEICGPRQTPFTSIPKECTEDDDLEELPIDDDDISKENKPLKYVRDSVVQKHRACDGHEVAFDIEQTSESLNLRAESIMTLICQLQQAYPQLKIKQHAPTRPTCQLICHKGVEQMEQLKKTCPAVREALFLHKQSCLRSQPVKYETPSKLVFDIIKVAKRLGKPSLDVMKMLRNTEWELVEKTGRFRRSQVRVNFEGNSFHLESVGDLTSEESDEIEKFLIDYMKNYEYFERRRVEKVYDVFKRHSIGVDKMKDKLVRLQTSFKLKTVLNDHFSLSLDLKGKLADDNRDANANGSNEIDDARIQDRISLVRKTLTTFLSCNHSREFTSRDIARIFQGIPTPRFPAEVWGVRTWWRSHLDLDFRKLVEIIQDEMLKMEK